MKVYKDHTLKNILTLDNFDLSPHLATEAIQGTAALCLLRGRFQWEMAPRDS